MLYNILFFQLQKYFQLFCQKIYIHNYTQTYYVFVGEQRAWCLMPHSQPPSKPNVKSNPRSKLRKFRLKIDNLTPLTGCLPSAHICKIISGTITISYIWLISDTFNSFYNLYLLKNWHKHNSFDRMIKHIQINHIKMLMKFSEKYKFKRFYEIICFQ